MKAVEFCYWLQGYFEITQAGAGINDESKGLDPEQVEMIQKHLNLVFVHDIDPSYPAEQQEKLNEIHNGKKPQIGGVDPVTGMVQRC